MAWRAVAMSGMRAAWKTGSFDLALEGADRLQERRERLRHAGHVVLGEREVGVHAAEDAVEEVDLARALEDASRSQALVEIDVVGRAFLVPSSTTKRMPTRKSSPTACGSPRAPSAPKRARFSTEPPKRSVRRLVRGDRNWPIRWPPVTVSMPSSPPSLQRLAAVGVVANDAGDVVLVHLAREVAMAALADRRRPHRRQPVDG